MSHLSTLALHRYRLGELSSSEADAAALHLESCNPCQARMAAAQEDDDAVAAEPLPAFLADLSDAPLPDEPPAPEPAQWAVFLRRVGMPAVSLLAAAAMLLVALSSMQRPIEDDGLRTRGDLPDLEVWLQSSDGHRPLQVGEALGDGDQVVLFFHPHDAERVAIAGRDHSGDIEVYRLLNPVKDGLQPAPFGLTLDDSPGVQEFFVVAGAEDFSESDAIDAILAMDRTVTRVVVPKEPAPPDVDHP